MPKVNNTRKQKAERLLELLLDGPDSIDREMYALWCRSWVLPLVRELVPELKKRADATDSEKRIDAFLQNPTYPEL